MLPPLTADGLLPEGQHDASWDDVAVMFAQTALRRALLDGLREVATYLAAADCARIWLDGSFVTNKDRPGDFDACWDPAGVDPARLHPALLDFSPAGRAAMQARFHGDIFPAGVELGSGLQFVEFFQRTRSGQRKGIVRLDPRTVS